MQDKIGIKFWLLSLGIFAVVVAIGMGINQGDVTLGIPEHQAAPNAERVDEIQTQWREGGVRGIAIAAMVADLCWIWIYALASFQVGRGFATKRQGVLRLMGIAIAASAVVFALTDYTETTLQFIQLLRDAGDDQMAAIASGVRPIKMVAFLAAFFGIIAALVIDRFSGKAAR